MADTPLKNVWASLQEKAVDLLSIDVTTFSAPNVTLELQEGKAFKIDELFKELEGKVKDGSVLNLVAHTHVDFDLDSVMIVKDGSDEKLMEAHNKAVQTAVEGRQSFIKALKDLF